MIRKGRKKGRKGGRKRQKEGERDGSKMMTRAKRGSEVEDSRMEEGCKAAFGKAEEGKRK